MHAWGARGGRAAAPGSTHGYDVVDHGRINPELGDEAAFDRLAEACAGRAMGLLLDFVPNHMGIGPRNAWWMDVLENGPSRLLDAQAYRLAFWRVAGEEINYRRFFDVNALAAIRMEEPFVFAAAHRLVLSLVESGKVTGLRIDHPDGLYEPPANFRRLGAFPDEGLRPGTPAFSAFVARIQRYMEKAMREAKRHTSWSSPVPRPHPLGRGAPPAQGPAPALARRRHRRRARGVRHPARGPLRRFPGRAPRLGDHPVKTVRFYLVRHARAEVTTPAGDAARQLTAEGRAGFAAHARLLAPRVTLSRVATSPLLRARETAELLAAATGAPVEEEDALAAGVSSGRQLLELGDRLGAGTALVGHNPEIAEAVALADGKRHEVSAGAIAAIDRDGDRFHLAWIEAPG